MDPNVHSPNPHGTPLFRVLVLLAFALLIVLLSSLGSYWYYSYQTQEIANRGLVDVVKVVILTPTPKQKISPSVSQDETANVENLVKDFYKKWITIPPVIGIEKNVNILANDGYLTANAVNSIKTALGQGYDGATCGQNPLKPEDYTYSTPVINGTKASMTLSGTYSGDNRKITIGLDLLKSGTKWMIDDFHCPK